MTTKKSVLISLIVSLVPIAVLAQTTVTLKSLMGVAATYLNTALQLLMGVAVLFFVWYIVQYFIRPGDKKKTEAAQYLLWSVIGFFVILSLWGIVNILTNTFNLNSTTPSWSTIIINPSQ